MNERAVEDEYLSFSSRSLTKFVVVKYKRWKEVGPFYFRFCVDFSNSRVYSDRKQNQVTIVNKPAGKKEKLLMFNRNNGKESNEKAYGDGDYRNDS